MKKAKWSFRELNTDLKSLNEMCCGNDRREKQLHKISL